MIHFHRYLPLSEQAHERSLSVIAAGYRVGEPEDSDTYSRSRPNAPWPPLHPPDHAFEWKDGRILSEYQLIYVTRGSGPFESKTCGPRPIEAGDLFALFPGEWHRYGPSRPDATGRPRWDFYWVAFTGRLAAEYVAECRLSVAEPILKVGVDKRLIEEYLCITDELRDLAAGYQEIMVARTLLILALAKAASLRQGEQGSEMVRMMERAKGLMLERIDQPPALEELASSLGVSYSWFRRMFRQHTGMSPAQYHLQYRLERACHLLAVTTLPVATIGASLGFETAHYFARIFKQKIGYTPRDYRARTQVPGIPE
jgi:AraC-like DNA-binding protein